MGMNLVVLTIKLKLFNFFYFDVFESLLGGV
jgi:hypothetical protein